MNSWHLAQPSLHIKRRRYVILDRNGTINVERHYLTDPALVELLPGATQGLRCMRMLGLGLIVATNQSGIGR
jgi:D-glycero-D-manno-heptose 1,7-bisphosphate phosphatase